jgi:F0F1-type ATP synthase delta subunit
VCEEALPEQRQELPAHRDRQRPRSAHARDCRSSSVLEECAGRFCDAVVYSAFPIDDGAGRVVGHAGEALRPQAQPRCSSTPALIGGIRVVVGDEVLDTSVKARLEQMKVALTA